MLHAQRRAENVDVEHPADLGGVDLRDQAGDLDPSVVDEDVQPAEVLDRLSDRGLPAGVVGDVEGDEAVVLSQTLGDRAARLPWRSAMTTVAPAPASAFAILPEAPAPLR